MESKTKRQMWPVWLVVAGLLVFGAVRSAAFFGSQVASGQVMVLGKNVQSQIGGRDRLRQSTVPEPIELDESAGAERFISARAGHYHTLLLNEKGQVYSFGGNSSRAAKDSAVSTITKPELVTFPDLKNDETIVQIDTSRDHNLALTSNGRVYAWGSNVTGQLGNGTNEGSGVPRLVEALPTVVKIAAGYRHSAAITEAGEVYGWGGSCTDAAYSAAQSLLETVGSNISALGSYGSISHEEGADDASECTTQDSTFVQSKTPKILNGLKGQPAEISIGYGHILVVTEAGKLFSAGCNTHGQLGRDKPKGEGWNDLVEVELPGKVKSAASGYRHSLVTLDNGEVYGWGYNGTGKSLLAESGDQEIRLPAKLQVPSAVVIEAAHDTSFLITATGEVYGWGQDDAGAFWPDVTPAEAQKKGSIAAGPISLSAGMQHLLVLVSN